jgi:hypothetical protein
MALGLCGASAAQAQYYYGSGPRYYDEGLPPYEIMRVVRSAGLAPLSRPVRRGPTYVVVAANRSGGQMRVVVDAVTGDIMTVNPMVAMRPYGAQPYYPGGAPLNEPPGAYGGDPRFDGGVPPVPPRDLPSARMMPAPGFAPPAPPREAPNARVATAPAHASPAAPPPPARTPMPRPRPNVAAASEPAPTVTGTVPAPATSKAPAAPVPTPTAPAIINPSTQMVPVAPLE